MNRLQDDLSTGNLRIADHVRECRERPSDVAIVGMACFLPAADDVRTYWENVLNRVDAVTEVPLDRWDWRLYYDADPKKRDKICSKWGGFLSDMPFDPLQFGMPPNSLSSIEPVQLFALEAVRRALADAGYAERPFDRERTAVVLGAGGGAAQLAIAYSFRSYLPMLATVPGLKDKVEEILREADKFLPEWTEDSFPGILINVIAGRVANRFNFGGPNYSIDAACGSSLAALHAGVRELEMGTSDTVVVLGADTVQNPYTYMAFSKTHAFSPRGRCSTFDEAADGIVISEGVAAVILKRLDDAQRDGDRIYAVIKGIGASSDGRDKGLTAPRPEGQLRALRRAYSKANISPARVEFVEAHGTGTAVGDRTEVASLTQVLREAEALPRSCVIGSVKSMIGHTKCAAGLAGLVNAALALHHKVLPPLLVEKPNSKAKFEEGPLYLNKEARPWIHGGSEPRVAGVSAFGFGGTNFHAVLEEYIGENRAEPQAALDRWPIELFVWRGASAAALYSAIQPIQIALARGAAPRLADLAFSIWHSSFDANQSSTLAIAATSLNDLRQKLDAALTMLQSGSKHSHDPRGIYFSDRPTRREDERIAFLFPGQGSQYPNMLAQLALVFPEVRAEFDEAETILAGKLDKPLAKFIFPPSAFTPEEEQRAKESLTRTEVAQPAIGAASLGMLRLLTRLGVRADLFAGHSYGDYVALHAAGALSSGDLIRLSHERGRAICDATERMRGAMAAIETDYETAANVLDELDGVMAANRNSPKQTVLSGTEQGIASALECFEKHGIRGQRIPVACAFHSPLVAAAAEPFGRFLRQIDFKIPQYPVYANTTGTLYPHNPAELIEILSRHLASPVCFSDEIEAMYAAGARIFVEVGPQNVLTGLVDQILSDRPHLAVASDVKGRPGLVQFQHLLGRLLVEGVSVQLERLYEGRGLRRLDLDHLERDSAPSPLSPSTWLVNSVRVRPINGPEPIVFGQSRADESASAPQRVERTIPDKNEVYNPPAMKPTVTQPSNPASNGAAHGNGVNPLPALPAPVAALPTEEAAQVMLRFQDMMSRFLDTQRSVMMCYLQGGSLASGLPPIPPLTVPPATNGYSANGYATNGHTTNGHGSNGHSAKSHTVAPLPPPVAVAPIVPSALPSQPEKEPEQTPAIVAASAATKGVDSMADRLLEIVCKRTGYPVEMLGLDLDLEADLGIDSIKRVEILGMLADANGGQNLNVSMEKMTNIKSLRGILDCLAAANPSEPNATKRGEENSVRATAFGTTTASPNRGGIQRMLVAPTNAPLLTSEPPLLPGGAILITDDGDGVASAFASRLRSLGQRVATIGSQTDEVGFPADLTDPEQVEAALARIRRECGSIHGLIHLLPLARPNESQDWSQRLKIEGKSLFLLARGLANELQEAAKHGSAILMAATALGGTFGSGNGEEVADDFSPAHGGVAGAIKSLAHEWPDVLVRVVDFQRRAEVQAMSDALFDELSDPIGPIEIGYRDGRRLTLQCVPSPLDTSRKETVPLDRDSTVLLTGGARGITAAVALELARRYRPNLVLIGRSPLPEDREESDTFGISHSAELKAVLIARLRREGRPASPATVESAYRRLMRDREIRGNIERLKESGARVSYNAVDVRDEGGMKGVLDDIYRRFGTIDGVVHGAGVIQDKRIVDKTPESYDRVFGTKVESALILSRHLDLEKLKFCVFFASVAGRFGNRGQADYAAANEVLSKLAIQLDRRWPARVVSLAWGPWSTIGMVSELEQHLGQRGLQMIPPEIGPSFFVEELCFGRKGECEVVVAGDVGQLACPRRKNDNRAVQSVR